MTSTTWRNWAGSHSCRPEAFLEPASLDALASAVRKAAAAGKRVKAVGSGHSFTNAACTDGVMVSLRRLNRVVAVDRRQGSITVQGGMILRRLNREIAARGLALPAFGEVDEQGVAGAISTGTHGTGLRVGSLSTFVSSLTMVLADGQTIRCSADEEAETFRAARLGLGALGVITEVTLACVPAFALRSVEGPARLGDVVAYLDRLVEGNEYFEFLWFPHTDGVSVRTANSSEREPKPRNPAAAFAHDVVLENWAFGLGIRAGRAFPSLIPGLNRAFVKGIRRREIVDRSDKIFARTRRVRYVEMEYGMPRAHVREVLAATRAMIEDRSLHVAFPVHVRFSAQDDVPLSPSFGRETGYVAVHAPARARIHPIFRAFESIAEPLEGRPHWGKLHFQTAETLRGRYPEWGSFASVRARLDPGGAFRNGYVDRVLGEG